MPSCCGWGSSYLNTTPVVRWHNDRWGVITASSVKLRNSQKIAAFRKLYLSNSGLNCSQCSSCSLSWARKIHIFQVTLVWRIWNGGRVDFTRITVMTIIQLDEQWRGNLLIKSWQLSHSQWHSAYIWCRQHGLSLQKTLHAHLMVQYFYIEVVNELLPISDNKSIAIMRSCSLLLI